MWAEERDHLQLDMNKLYVKAFLSHMHTSYLCHVKEEHRLNAVEKACSEISMLDATVSDKSAPYTFF